MKELNRSILITGLKHCGKSSSGRCLAELYSTPFVDVDDIAEEIFAEENKLKLSSREIYRRGREVFQEYEYKASNKISADAEKYRLVCSAGGGICDNSRALKSFTENFCIIFISEKPEILYERIIRNGIPAFLSAEHPYKDFIGIYETRNLIYDKINDIKITAEGKPVSKICRLISERLLEEGYAR